MVHVLASFGFSLVALAALALIAATLVASSEAILRALGISEAPISQAQTRAIRVRSAGRWQSVQTASAQLRRAAA